VAPLIVILSVHWRAFAWKLGLTFTVFSVESNKSGAIHNHKTPPPPPKHAKPSGHVQTQIHLHYHEVQYLVFGDQYRTCGRYTVTHTGQCCSVISTGHVAGTQWHIPVTAVRLSVQDMWPIHSDTYRSPLFGDQYRTCGRYTVAHNGHCCSMISTGHVAGTQWHIPVTAVR